MNDVPDFYAGWAANGGDYSDSRTECRDYSDYDDQDNVNDVTYRTPRTAAEANGIICALNEDKERMELFVSTCDAKIEFYKRQKLQAQTSFDNERKYKELLLGEYLKTAPVKKAKNSESLRLPDGTIRRTYATTRLVPDEDKLIEAYRGTEFVETVEKVKWGELKKRITQDGNGNVIDTATGEIVSGVTVEAVEEKVSVQF